MSGHTDNSILIAAPVERVWEVANDIERWPELFAGEYASAEVLERGDRRVTFRLTTEPRDGNVYSWTSERFLDRDAGTVHARRIDLGPFRYMHIFQSFTPEAGGTRLRWVQDFEIRPGAPITDEQMAARINAGSARNLATHKAIIEGTVVAEPDGPDARGRAHEHGHVDVRVVARAPLDVVWQAANDRGTWARTGHPVRDASEWGTESTFDVTTPPDWQGRSWTFTVHRLRDDDTRTVYSRRYGCDEMVYSTVWFHYEPVADGTEMRCVTDFEMAPGASATTAEMAQITEVAMQRNLTQIAAAAEGALTETGGARARAAGSGQGRATATQLVDEAWMHIESGDMARLAALFSPDVELSTSAGEGTGRDYAIGLFSRHRSGYPDIRHRVLDRFESAGGDAVVTRLEFEATHLGELRGPFGTVEPTGRRLRWRSCDLVRSRDGLIVSWHAHFDRLTVLQQLGLTPPPVPAPAPAGR
jgi:aromatase